MRRKHQTLLVREIAKSSQATQKRTACKLVVPDLDQDPVVEGVLRSRYHGSFVIFDGGTPLADRGLTRIIDKDGIEFDRSLHEQSFKH